MGGAEPVPGHAAAGRLISRPWHDSFADNAALDRYLARNPESYSGSYPASHRTGYLPENPARCREGCPDRNEADRSPDCPENRPESNREDNPAYDLPSYSAD